MINLHILIQKNGRGEYNLASTYPKSVILTNLIPIFDSTFKNTSNLNKYLRFIQTYIDKNNEIINHNTPSYRLTFDIQPLYDLFNLSDDKIKLFMKDMKNVNGLARNQAANNPRYVMMTTLIYYFHEKKKRVYEEHSLMYLTLIIYSALYKKYYKFQPNDSIMQYTFNRVSNRFYFKRFGTVFKAIYEVANVNNESMIKSLEKKSDENILKYVISLYSRLNNMMQSFSIEFYKDQKSKNYLSNSKDSMSDDTIFDDPKSMSLVIKNVTNKTMNSFVQNAVDIKIVRTACSLTQTNYMSLYNTLNDIKKKSLQSAHIIILGIVSAYLHDDKNEIDSIGSQKFISKSISTFNMNRSEDPAIVSMKKELNSLLKKYNDKYTHTEREATKSAYRKALFLYFVFLVAQTN